MSEREAAGFGPCTLNFSFCGSSVVLPPLLFQIKFEYVDSFLVAEFEIHLSSKWKLLYLHKYYSAVSFELKL